jgi:iron complex outermembrane receptor protein
VYSGDIGEVRPSIIVSTRPGPEGKQVLGVAGGNVLARWTRKLAAGSEIQVRAYYDATHHDDPSFVDNLDTVDVEAQHRFRLPLGQEVLWGVNYRSMDERTRGKGIFALNPPDSHDNLFSGFLQDQVGVLDSLKVTLGTKVEHNDFSGFEVQPTARVSWSPLHDQTFWGAASRAVRIPTRLERDVDIGLSDPAGNPVLRLVGNRAFGSEKLFAYELGYRWQIERALYVDLAAYYNIYKGLASLELDPRFIDPQTGQTVFPIRNKNLTDGVAKGGEASITFTPLHPWRLVGNYTYVLLTLDPKGRDLNRGGLYSRSTPRNQIGLQSFLDLPAGFQLDLFLRYASAVPASSQLVAGEDTPAYATADVRAGWQWERLEFSLVGRNLAQRHHREFPGGTEMKRAFYLKIAGRL